MPEQDDKILNELKRRAREEVRQGTMMVEFKVQDGILISGEVIQERIKLG